MKTTMHKTAREFALKNRINLGRWESNGNKTGHYFITGVKGEIMAISNEKKAWSAIAMMKRFIRNQKVWLSSSKGFKI